MKRTLIHTVLVLCCCACTQRKVDRLQQALHNPAIEQEKQLLGTKMILSYMPPKAIQDTTELMFRLRIFPDNRAAGRVHDNAASFGTDSLFRLVVAGDSIAPLYSQRIANGNISGMEYLVAFDRQKASHAGSARFVFSDWLFTSNRIDFPYIMKYIQKVDALSCSL